MRTIQVPDGTPITVDGVVFGTGATPTPAPAPAIAGVLEPLYFNVDDLTKALNALHPAYQVWCDSNNGPALAGSGTQLPAIRYGSRPTGIVALMNPEHPYFAPAKAAVEAAPMAAKLKQATTDEALINLWETTPSTTDPRTMDFLLKWMGYTDEGRSPLEQAKLYRKWYYTKYGRQAPPPAPRNPEVLTDAELAAIIAS